MSSSSILRRGRKRQDWDRAGSREQGVGEQGVGGTELGAGSWEQGAGSRGHGWGAVASSRHVRIFGDATLARTG